MRATSSTSWSSSPIALEQIAFADVIVLNKIDLVDAAALERIERRVRGISATAAVIHSRNADVPLERVLSLGAFDLERALALDEAFLEPARPFEWAGLYSLSPGRQVLQTGAHDHSRSHEHRARSTTTTATIMNTTPARMRSRHGHALAQVDLVLLPAADVPDGSIDATARAMRPCCSRAMPVPAAPGAVLGPQRRHRLQLAPDAQFELQIAQPGCWALFCRARASGIRPASAGRRAAAAARVRLASSRSRDRLHRARAMRARSMPTKVNDWLSYLLQSRGADILRMKGVLNLKGENRRYVFHGVHMVFDGQLERPWSDAGARRSRLVFIGRNLDRAEFEAGFESCVA